MITSDCILVSDSLSLEDNVEYYQPLQKNTGFIWPIPVSETISFRSSRSENLFIQEHQSLPISFLGKLKQAQQGLIRKIITPIYCSEIQALLSIIYLSA